MNTQNRFQSFCFAIFAIALSVAITANTNLDLKATFGRFAPLALFVAGIFSYAAFLKIAIFLVNNIPILKRIYWGEMYFDGIWYYTSFEGGKEFFGIWRIIQDVSKTKVVAFGLDEYFRRRSTVQSVSDLIGHEGVFEVINVRRDVSEGDRQQYSKTIIVPDKPTGVGLQKMSRYMRGETVVYGGKLDGLINYDLRMERWGDVMNEEEAIKKVKRIRSDSFSAVPASHPEADQHDTPLRRP